VRDEWSVVNAELMNKMMTMSECHSCGKDKDAKGDKKKKVESAKLVQKANNKNEDAKSEKTKVQAVKSSASDADLDVDTAPASGTVTGSKKKGSLLLKRQLVMRSGDEGVEDEKKQMEQILKFEKLESEFQELRKDLTSAIQKAGNTERALDHEKERLEIKIQSNEAETSATEAINKKIQSNIDHAAESLTAYTKVKKEEVTRKKKDLETAKKQIAELDEQMKSCGCLG